MTLSGYFMLSALHDQLASIDRHAQLRRCFSAVAELLVTILAITCRLTQQWTPQLVCLQATA